DARLIDDAGGLTDVMLAGVRTLGLTAGASAPEVLVDGVLDALRARFEVALTEDAAARETVTFKLPRQLADQPAG
ncbi:4-hydroxy-3-methylbut-2-enyl diphosphate reductase, partial [Acinetobacter baumannii]